jgi:hypothetical protein
MKRLVEIMLLVVLVELGKAEEGHARNDATRMHR